MGICELIGGYREIYEFDSWEGVVSGPYSGQVTVGRLDLGKLASQISPRLFSKGLRFSGFAFEEKERDYIAEVNYFSNNLKNPRVFSLNFSPFIATISKPRPARVMGKKILQERGVIWRASYAPFELERDEIIALKNLIELFVVSEHNRIRKGEKAYGETGDILLTRDHYYL